MNDELRPNPSLYPKNGYRHRDPASGLTFTGDSWEGVAKRLAAHRQANGLPPGEPLREVYDAFCELHPTYCRAVSPRVHIVHQTAQNTGFMRAVVEWIGGMIASLNPGRQVSGTEMNRRLMICRMCPAQRNITTGCGGCDKQIGKLRGEAFRKGGVRRTDVSSMLLGCSALEEDPSLSVWFRQAPRKGSKAPANCWRRNETG